MFLFHSLLIDALKFWFSEKCTWLNGRMSSFGGYRNTHFLWWIIWLKADLAILLSSLIEICIVPWSGSSTKTKKYKKICTMSSFGGYFEAIFDFWIPSKDLFISNPAGSIEYLYRFWVSWDYNMVLNARLSIPGG